MLRTQEKAAVIQSARQELLYAEGLLGDFVVYPTLFVRAAEGDMRAVARGYGSYEKVDAAIRDALAGASSHGAGAVHACGLDGTCV